MLLGGISHRLRRISGVDTIFGKKVETGVEVLKNHPGRTSLRRYKDVPIKEEDLSRRYTHQRADCR